MFLRVVLFLFFCLWFGTAVAAESLIPIEAFVERQQFSLPRLSPDGKHIAVLVQIQRDDRSVPIMHVYSLPTLKVVSAISLPVYEVPVNFGWVSNTRLVVAKGIEVGLKERPQSTGEIVAVNFDGTKPEYLYGYKYMKQSFRGQKYGNDYGHANVSHIPLARDGKVVLITQEWDANRSMLYEINSNNANRKLLASIAMKDLDFLHQNDGTARFASSFDNDNNAVLFKYDDASSEWKKLDRKNLGKRYHPFAFLPGDQSYLATYSKTGEATSLVREDLTTGTRNTLVQDSLGDIQNIEYTAYPEVPFAVTVNTGIPKARYIDATLPDAQLYKTLSEAFPQHFVHFINFSDDGKTLLFGVSSDRDPGSYYLFDKTTGKADLLFSNKPLIDPDHMSAKRPIKFTARDGLEITGYLTLPKNAETQKVPLILHPHGGPFDVKDDWFFDDDVQFLANRGYAVLQVNFRGSSGRGPNFLEAGYKEWGGKIMNDLIDGVKWAKALPEIKPDQICVYGASFGGYAALMLPVREPAMFKCAVGYSGRYDLASKYTQDSASGNIQVKRYLEKTMGSDPAELAKNSPTHLADQIKLPVMMVHGGKDKTTELGQAEEMRDALIKAGNPPDWTYEKIEGHGFYDAENRKSFYQKLEIFLKKHLVQ